MLVTKLFTISVYDDICDVNKKWGDTCRTVCAIALHCKTKTYTNPNPDPNRYRRRCPDPNARIQKFGKDCVSYYSYHPSLRILICILPEMRCFVDVKIAMRCKIKKRDSKSFFAYARSKTKSKIQPGSISSDNGELLDSDIKIVQEFNKYFSSVFTAENTSNMPVPEPVPVSYTHLTLPTIYSV